MKRYLFLLFILVIASAANAQMLSKETGEPINRNARIQHIPSKPILMGQKFTATAGKRIKIENGNPQIGKTCTMEQNGHFAYIMQYDSSRLLMIYEHPAPSFTGCPSGVTFMMPKGKIWTEKRITKTAPNAINVKQRLIRRNMQRN